MLETKDAPGSVGVGSVQLSTLIEGALNNALNQRFPGAPGQVIALPGVESPESASMAQEPQNEIMKAIYDWSLNSESLPPTDGQVFFMGQDRNVEVLSNEQLETRLATMGQPALAGTVNTLDGIGGLDIPWGSVLLGALPGALVSEVVDGLMPPRGADGNLNFTNLLVKGGIAWAGVQFGDRLVGRRAAQFFAGGLILFVLADFLPVDNWVAQIMGLFGGSGSAGAGQDRIAAHEQRMAAQGQTRSAASTFNPSSGDDSLEALRGHRARRAA